MVQRAWARLSDHRVWIVGIGVLAFFSSIGLLFVIPQQFQPTTNSDYSQVKYELPPGPTLEQSETIARQIGALLDDRPVVETAFYDGSVGGGDAFLPLKKHRAMPSVQWDLHVQPQLAAINTEGRRGGQERGGPVRSRW